MKALLYTVFAAGFLLTGCSKHSSTPAQANYTKITYTGHTYLSEARQYLTAAGAGNKIVFAGGDGNSGFSKIADICDVKTNTWTTTQLSEARYFLAAAATGNKIVFAGGLNSLDFSKTADIYDVKTNTWTTAQLSEARDHLAAAGAGNKIVFAGRYGNSGFSKQWIFLH